MGDEISSSYLSDVSNQANAPATSVEMASLPMKKMKALTTCSAATRARLSV
jgi:hypothetical protein